MSFPKISGYQAVLHLVLTGLAILVAMLVTENRDLRSQVVRERQASVPAASPAAGELLPSIEATDLEGRDIELTFNEAGRSSMLFVFTTSCPACKANLPQWLALREHLGERYDIIGISLDSRQATRTYIADHSLPFSVFVPTDPNRFRSDYGLPGVPETLHAGPDGRVQGAWLGVLPEGFSERFVTENPEIAELPADPGKS